jgi:hypothetical protein
VQYASDIVLRHNVQLSARPLRVRRTGCEKRSFGETGRGGDCRMAACNRSPKSVGVWKLIGSSGHVSADDFAFIRSTSRDVSAPSICAAFLSTRLQAPDQAWSTCRHQGVGSSTFYLLLCYFLAPELRVEPNRPPTPQRRLARPPVRPPWRRLGSPD